MTLSRPTISSFGFGDRFNSYYRKDVVYYDFKHFEKFQITEFPFAMHADLSAKIHLLIICATV